MNEKIEKTVMGALSLRDYFAAGAMQSAMTGAILPTKEDRDKYLPLVANISYEVADAMLRARDAE